MLSPKNTMRSPGAMGVMGVSACKRAPNNKGKINEHTIFDWEYETTMSLIVCDDNFTDFFYLQSGTIYHNGDQVLVNDESISATSLMYVNGNCWYYKSNEVGYIDSEENLQAVKAMLQEAEKYKIENG